MEPRPLLQLQHPRVLTLTLTPTLTPALTLPLTKVWNLDSYSNSNTLESHSSWIRALVTDKVQRHTSYWWALTMHLPCTYCLPTYLLTYALLTSKDVLASQPLTPDP